MTSFGSIVLALSREEHYVPVTEGKVATDLYRREVTWMVRAEFVGPSQALRAADRFIDETAHDVFTGATAREAIDNALDKVQILGEALVKPIQQEA